MTKNMKDKLSKLENDINHLKKEAKKKEISETSTSHNMKYVTQITVDLVSGLAVGGFLGYEIDKYFETKPLCFIVFMLLGMAGGFLNTMRSLK